MHLPFDLYAKEGEFVAVQDALGTQYVAENTTIPVPQILDVIQLASCEGVTLNDMPESQRAVFTEILRGWFDQLRCLPPLDDRTISSFM
jgi:hypothetical protein